MSFYSSQEHTLIHSVTRGTGRPTLYLFHGLAGNHEHFEHQAIDLASTFETVNVDLPGHGKSVKRAYGLSLDSISSDLMGFIEARSGLANSILVGHSFGAIVALNIAANASRSPSGIIMLDAPILFPDVVVESMGPFRNALMGDGYSDALRKFANDYYFRAGDTSERKMKIIENLLEYPKQDFITLWEQLGRFDALAALSHVSCPTFFVHSSTPTDLTKYMSVGPHVSLEQVSESGHFVQLEMPQRVNTLIRNFSLEIAGTGKTQPRASISETTTSP